MKSELAQRREFLLNKMNELIGDGYHCFDCTGVCCTDKYNSMKISKEEALHIQNYLLAQGLWNEHLKTKLRHFIKKYRLDVLITVKKDLDFRRTYTCPFYKGTKMGCELPLEIKPLGCLAFNPNRRGNQDGESCQVYESGSGLKSDVLLDIPQALMELFQ